MRLSQFACDRGEYTAAEKLAAEALRLARAEQDFWNEGWALVASSRAALGLGAHEKARGFLEAGLALARKHGEPWLLTAAILSRLGELGSASGQLRQARLWLQSSIDLRDRSGERRWMAYHLERLATVEAGSGHFGRALRLAGAADSLYARLDTPRMRAERNTLEQWMTEARRRLGPAAVDQVWEEGRTLELQDAVAFALRSDEHDAPVVSVAMRAASGLTPREREVAALLAYGLSNREIAERLVVTERTAAAHVEHILSKLGFASRHQAGAWVTEHGVLG
jgi:DNA-binding CsgD family transcriptional regulator